MQIDLHSVERTGSTNQDIRRAIDEGAPEGFAVLAGEQTAGYGRQGGAWASPAGGMYLSVLLRPERRLEEWPALSLLAAVVLRRAVISAVPALHEVLRIKYPNDVVVSGDAMLRLPLPAAEQERPLKLAGILPENHAGAVALGFGLNVLRSEGFGIADTRNTPVFLSDFAYMDDGTGAIPGNPVLWARVVLDELGKSYAVWAEQGFSPFAGEYEAVSAGGSGKPE